MTLFNKKYFTTSRYIPSSEADYVLEELPIVAQEEEGEVPTRIPLAASLTNHYYKFPSRPNPPLAGA